MTSEERVSRPNHWTLLLRGRVRAIERQLHADMPSIKGHSKKAEQARRAEWERRRTLRAELETLIPLPPQRTSDNGVHEYVETKEYVLFRNHGESWWRGVLKIDGGYVFVPERSRLQATALRHVERAFHAAKAARTQQ